MAVKLFVLGLPGSGKSGVARYIQMYARDKDWKATHFNDYAILKQMFHNDTKEQFKPAPHGGFDVIDFTVIDTALQRLEQEVNQHLSSAKPKEIILIEFARNDYQKAFQQFNQDFLQDAYFLYLDAEIETCKQRIRDRVNNPAFEDDYNVSDYIFETYYHEDDGKALPYFLEREHRIGKQRISIIDNNCSLEEASKEIAPFIDTISESACASTLAQAEKLLVGIQ
jgi:adenylate kinase family enzyme